MNLESLVQSGPAKAHELFTRLGETSASDTSTRERIFSELKAELERHVSLEEEHLFPILRRADEAKDILAQAVRENAELRAKLSALEALPKTDATFTERAKELQKTFRQHARDEKQELLPAVQRARREQQHPGASGTTTATAPGLHQTQHQLVPDNQRDQQAEQRASAERARIAQEQAQRAAAEQERARLEQAAAERLAAQRAAAEQLDQRPARPAALQEQVAHNSQPARHLDIAVPQPAAQAPSAFVGAMTEAWLGWVGKASLTGMQISQELLSRTTERQWRFAAEAVRGWIEQNARVMQATMDMVTKTSHLANDRFAANLDDRTRRH